MTPSVGERIRRFRNQAGWSLRDLARRSGVAYGTLSRIENGKFVGHVTTHQKVCQALGVSIAELYRGTALLSETAPTPVVAHPHEAETFTYDHHASAVLLAKQVLEKKMLPQLILLEPSGTTHLEQHQSGSEKWVFVLQGRVEVIVGKASYPLDPDGTLYFNASVPHRLRNPGTEAARCISVTSPVSL